VSKPYIFFFFQCTEEAHRPVDCATVSKWILKNSAESENMNWYRRIKHKFLNSANCLEFLLWISLMNWYMIMDMEGGTAVYK
jgi:hypothetical protein